MARAHDDTSAALVARRAPTVGERGARCAHRATDRHRGRHEHHERVLAFRRQGRSDRRTAPRRVRATRRRDRPGASTGSAVADLVAVATTYREFAITHPRYYEIMFSTSPTTKPRRQTPDGLDRYLRRVEQAIDTSALPDGLEPRSAAIWMWATCHGMVSLELNGLADESVDWSHVYDSGVHAALAGLASRCGAGDAAQLTAPIRGGR